MLFESERALTQFFGLALSDESSPFSSDRSAIEFDYREGRTDVILSDIEGNLVAFEMKLEKWKQALFQAYRNSSFAHYSYVVLPLETAKRAANHEYEFIRRGVGLCAVGDEEITIEITARRSEPLRPWITESALDYIYGGNNVRGFAI